MGPCRCHAHRSDSRPTSGRTPRPHYSSMARHSRSGMEMDLKNASTYFKPTLPYQVPQNVMSGVKGPKGHTALSLALACDCLGCATFHLTESSVQPGWAN